MGSPHVWYQVLNLWGLALFQSRFRLSSFNETITVACVVSVFVCLFVPENLHLLHTGLKSRSGVGSGVWIEREEESVAGTDWICRCSTSTLTLPTPLTLIYLWAVGKHFVFLKSHGLEGNWSSRICFTIMMDQTKLGTGSLKRVEFANLF